MLRLLGHPSTACDGLTRRELLTAGALSLFGALHPAPSAPARKPGRARSVILLDLFGGPSHLDTFDLKPDAPAEVRGEFKPIATSLTGVRICEHLPRLATRMHKVALIRTVSHKYNSHNPYGVLTGFDGGNDRENYYAKTTDHPGMGTVIQYFGLGRTKGIPPYVMLPAFPGYSQGLRRAGPYGGYLGSAYDPLFSTCSPTWNKAIDANRDFYDHTVEAMGDPRLPDLASGLTLDALDRRKSLLGQLDSAAKKLDSSASQRLDRQQKKAFELLLSEKARLAFDVSREPERVRDRYGRDLFGSSVLLSRRLVEAGVTFITVHTEAKPSGHWDTHSNNFKMLRHLLLPFLDRALSALLDDLEVRGLLDSTLVVVTGDMGRTPRVNKSAGRDHWPQCGFCLFAGAGIRPGTVLGVTDKQAGYPLEHAVSAGDLVSTIYELLGVDPEGTVPDHTNRPVHIGHGGKPIRKIMA